MGPFCVTQSNPTQPMDNSEVDPVTPRIRWSRASQLTVAKLEGLID